MTHGRADLRRLAQAHGSDPTVEQALNPGMRVWLNADRSAGVGYAVGRAPGKTVWFAAGGPICAPEKRTAASSAFENAARAAGAQAAWFGVCDATAEALGPGHASLVIGAEPVWDPAHWAETVAGRASLRSQTGRAARQGVVVAEEHAQAAAVDPGVRAVLAFWLTTRGMPPLAFLANPHVLDHPGDRRAFVARQSGRVVGVLWLAPVPARGGWLVEWNWRGERSPNGVTDGLLDAAMRAVAAEGARFVTLGLVPLSSLAPLSPEAPPLLVRAALGWTRAHARRFYRFDGLERFKAKYRPERWETLSLAVAGERVGLRTLYAVADVFSGRRGPVRLVTEALGAAAADEVQALAKRGAEALSWRRSGRSRTSSG